MSDTNFARPTGVDWAPGGKYGMVQYGDDSKNVVNFYWRSVQDEQASKAENKPIYKNVAYFRCHPPGEMLNIVDRPATDAEKYKYPRHWNQFVKKQAQIPEGTPIDLLFPNNPAYADMLKAQGIWTVQQLANLSAPGMATIGMGAQEAVNKANTYIKESGDSKATNQLRQQLDEKDHQIKVMQQNITMQKKQIDELFAKLGGMTGPNINDMSPVTTRDYDPQTERINSTHPTQEIKRGNKFKRNVPVQPTKDELEHAKVLKELVIEEVPGVGEDDFGI